MSKKKIIFHKSFLPLILEAFEIVEHKGRLVDKKNKEPILDPEGEEIGQEELGAIVGGSTVFYKKDNINSLIDYVESRECQENHG